jgi:uncharacterized membrane protein
VSVDSPSRLDPVVRALSGVAGGPAGRRVADARGFWRALPVLCLFAVVTLSLGVVQKAHCQVNGWSSPDHFWHACYSDIPVLYSSASLGTNQAPTVIEAVGAAGLGQPPLTGAAMWLVSRFVSPTPAATAPIRYFDYSAVLLLVALLVGVVTVALAAGQRRRWDAAQVALAPVLLTSALISYDLLALAFLGCALLAWARSRPVLAGLMLGLAVVSRPVTAILAVALLGACLRAGRLAAWAWCALTTAGVWVVVRVLLFPSPVGALSATWQSWKASTPGYGSIWLVPQLLQQSRPASARFWYTGPAFNGSGTTIAALLGLLAVSLATVLLALSPRHRPRIGHLALFAVAGALLVIKSLPVQAGLLLLPLIALAGLRWRDHLIWATTELAYFVGVWLYIAAASEPNRGLPTGFYLALLLARCAGIAWLAVQATRAAIDPVRDPVRVPIERLDDGNHYLAAEPADDPSGGPVDGRPDALIVRLA